MGWFDSMFGSNIDGLICNNRSHFSLMTLIISLPQQAE